MSALSFEHLFGLENVLKKDIDIILDMAFKFREILDRPIKKVPSLQGKNILNLFFENSTRTKISFELAAKLAFREASIAAKAVIMEPIMKLEVLTPEENMGDIVGDLNRRRGKVNSMDDRAGAKVVAAEVPLSEMFGYVTSLRTLSSGRATSTMEFSHYAETPSNISESVISEIKGNIQE